METRSGDTTEGSRGRPRGHLRRISDQSLDISNSEGHVSLCDEGMPRRQSSFVRVLHPRWN